MNRNIDPWSFNHVSGQGENVPTNGMHLFNPVPAGFPQQPQNSSLIKAR